MQLWCEARNAGSQNSWKLRQGETRHLNRALMDIHAIFHEIMQEMAKMHVYPPLKLLQYCRNKILFDFCNIACNKFLFPPSATFHAIV